MRGIAWDDKPADYLEILRHHLQDYYNVKMVIVDSPVELLAATREGLWDFVVTDWVMETEDGTEDKKIGLDLVHRLSGDLPVFVVTRQFKAIELSDFPNNVIFKSKSTLPAWMAHDIVSDLRSRGVFVDHRKVFLIKGMGSEADGSAQTLELFLEEIGLQVVTAKMDVQTEILQGLIDRMNECGAILAICTPDDLWPDGTRHVRHNVVLEIGIAVGLKRGLQRLIILQQWGPSPELKTHLPSDLSQVVSIRFYNQIEDVFGKLQSRLETLGAQI